ncbi:rab11 family-interacting protein 4 [Rhinophrynus dorsalis]
MPSKLQLSPLMEGAGDCAAGYQGPRGLSVQRLRQVFDVCDEDSDGFITVEHFITLGVQFAQGQEVEKLAKRLDPNDLGRISFQDFCHGVLAIPGCDQLLHGVLGVNPPHYEVEFTDYYYQNPEISDGIYLDTPSEYNDSELFSDEYSMRLTQQALHHESDLDSAIESTQSLEASDDCRSEDKAGELEGLYLPVEQNHLNPSAASDFSSRSTASLISSEEQFEDYGEGEDVDFTPSSPCPDDEGRANGFSDLGSSVSSSAVQTPCRSHLVYSSELLDIYCAQCCRKISLLNDLESRLKNLKANSPKKISSTAFGRQLFHSSNLSSSNGSTEDLFRDSIDSCDNDLTEKVSFLEKKVTELENDNVSGVEVKSKLKQENTRLVHRVHELEELLKDQETRSEQIMDEELKRHREMYSKLEKERGTEIELLNSRVQELEEENEDLLRAIGRLKVQTEKMVEERQQMSDKLEDTSLRLKDEMDLYKKLMDKLRQNRLHFQRERDATHELIEDLRRELEHLHLYRLDCECSGRGRTAGLGDFSAKTREIELDNEIRRLKMDNQKLRDQNDDLSGQILSLSLYEAKNLFSTQTKAQCLAAEIDSASRDELMEALKEQEEINFRLRQYMDKIILAILDHNPSILEIKN